MYKRQVKNVGGVAGKEVVQLYVHARTPAHPGPTRQLRALSLIHISEPTRPY